jgi:Uma2 family endonuclease
MSRAQPRPVPAGTMSFEQFLAWADEDTLAEWVDGQVVMTSPASVPHQELAEFVQAILKGFAGFHGLGKVLGPPFQMKLPASSGREPDVLFVASAHLGHLKRTYLDGPADLVVEVISPESVERDRQTKFAEHQRGGVLEYWIIDPDARQADFYQLDAQGAYQRVLPDAQGIYRSASLPAFWLEVGWLWQDPLPDEQDVLLAVIGKPYADRLRQRIARQGL